jgi:LuxR family maltose regulon positive regulatory protein
MMMITPTLSSGSQLIDPHAWELPRQRLQLPAEAWTRQKLVVAVSAGPGYGKSTLLTQWRRKGHEHGYRIMSLTAEPNDYEGIKLLMELARALGRDETEGDVSILDTRGDDCRLALVKALLADLNSEQKPTALFIDDIHELQDASSNSVLRMLLRYQPDGLMLVLSGRTSPMEVGNRAMLEGRLLRYTGAQLAFNDTEITELLTQHGIRPRPDLSRRLLELTQGWPAAVRLVALSLQNDEESQEVFLKALLEGQQPLTQYLNDTFFSQEPARTKDFLLRLSVLRNFTPSLAAAVTGMDDAAEQLDALQRRGLPITRTHGTEPSYTLHPLVRDFLRTQVGRSTRKVIEMSRDRAREWLIAHGQIDAAIEVCLDSDDVDTAASLINQHALVTVQTYGLHTTFLHWVNKLPPATLHRFPEIKLRQAWSLEFHRRHSEAEQKRRELEAELAAPDYVDGVPGRPPRKKLQQAIELQRFVQAGLRDQARESTALTQAWLERWPEADAFDRATAHTVLAFSTKALSDFTAGLEHARKAEALGRQAGSPYIMAWANMVMVSNLMKQGDYRLALYESERALETLAANLGKWSRSAMMLHALRAGLLYEFDRRSEVGLALDRGLTTLIEESSTDPMIVGYVTLARLQNLQGAQLEALETLAEGEVLGRSKGLPRLTISLGAERVVLLLRYGEVEQAQQLWAEIQQNLSCGNRSDAFERAMLDKSGRIHARIAIRRHRLTEGCELLALPLRHARNTSQKKKQVEIMLLQALALHEAKQTRKALTLFRQTLDIAIPEGYLRSFCDEGDPVRRLMTDFMNSSEHFDPRSPTAAFLEQLSQALAPEPAAVTVDPRARPDQLLIEPLTSRELQILSKLQSGLSNRQLSNSLFITEGTLKWHLRNVYGKLQVSSRLAAVAKARELNLLNG